MGGWLVPRGEVTRSTSTALTTTGPTASTAPVSFEGEVLTWEQMPARTRRAARRSSTVVGEAVEPVSGVQRDGGRAVEAATAWRVHVDAVVLAHVVRPVAPAPAGGLRVVGPWEDRGVRVVPAVGPPRRRRGVVDIADDLTNGPVRSGGAGAASSVARAWAYLPAVVRADAERLVPTPTTWFAQLIQVRSADGFPKTQDLRALRMSRERAVVIAASRELPPVPGAGIEHHVAEMARVPWVVEQVGLDLAAGASPTLLTGG